MNLLRRTASRLLHRFTGRRSPDAPPHTKNLLATINCETCIVLQSPPGNGDDTKGEPVENNCEPSLCFAVDSFLLHEMIRYLTKTPDEDVVYLSGIKLGHYRILTRLIPVELESCSHVRAIAQPQSCAQELIKLVEADLPFVGMAHSHPGRGPDSTRPSGVDFNYLGTIQKNGAEAVGLIVNRDGFVRFFTSSMPFSVVIQGNDFQPVKNHENVFRLAS